MNKSVYKKIVSELKKKYPYPKDIPKLEQCYQGYFPDSNQRLVKKYLYSNDKLIIVFGAYLGEAVKYICENISPGMMVIAVDTWGNVNNNNSRKKLYNTFIVNTWNHLSKIIPLKMENIKAAKYLSFSAWVG